MEIVKLSTQKPDTKAKPGITCMATAQTFFLHTTQVVIQSLPQTGKPYTAALQLNDFVCGMMEKWGGKM